MRNSIFHILLVSISLLSCKKEDDSVEMPVTRSSNRYNSLFTRYGNGWTGGDGTISLKLSNDKVLWFFGDTFLDTVYADRSRPTSARLIKNTIVIQDGDNLQTLYSSTSPISAFASPQNKEQWYWPLGAIEQDHVIEVVYQKLEKANNSSPSFDFVSVGTDIVQLDKNDFTILNIQEKLTHSELSFGTSIVEEGNYTYIYGVEDRGDKKYIHVARVPKGSLLQEWKYWNGVTWANTIANSKRLIDNVSTQHSVFKFLDKFYLLTQENGFSNRILLYEAVSPAGPWENEKTIFNTPNLGPDIWTYNAMAHPWISDENELLISYNVNSFNFDDIFTNADYYRPYFIILENFPE